MSDVVRHEQDGLLFDSGDSVSLAQQLQRLIDDPALLARLKDGIGPVKSIADEMTTIQQIYHSAIEKSRVDAEHRNA
jgi:glycosyltransferase involved in cell wall biosynthesis